MDVSGRPAEHERRRQAVDELVFEHARVSGDAFPLDARHWAIHGLIPVDGDVILAKFEDRAEARAAIERLWESEER